MPLFPQPHQNPPISSQSFGTCEHRNPHGWGSPHVPGWRVEVGVEADAGEEGEAAAEGAAEPGAADI